MKKALVLLDGRIAEVRDDVFPVHPDLRWVDVPDGTTTRDTFIAGVIIKDPPSPLPPPALDVVDQIATLSPVRRAALKTELAKL